MACWRRSVLLDLLVIGALVVVPALLYVGGLGFYSDDWHFLSVLSLAPQQGLASAVRALAPDLGARPPHLLLLAALFQVSQLNPLGYHLASVGLLLVAGLGMYLVLLELRIPRPLAFGVCAAFVALPHYSTDRFWTAAIQANIGLAFFVLGVYAALRARRAGGTWGLWVALAATGLVVAVLAYEVFLGLAVLVPILIVLAPPRQARSATLALVLAASIVGVVLFKIATTTRLPEFPSLLARVRWFAAVLRDGGFVGFGGYGIGLPVLALDATLRWPDVPRLVTAIAMGALAGAWAYRLAARSDSERWRASGQRLIVGGFVVFVAGLAIFWTNYAFAGTLSGSGNRTMIGAAIGVAAVLTGLAALASIFATARASIFATMRASTFAAAMGVVCLSGTLLNLTLASFWVDAAAEQAHILQALRAAAPTLPNNATVLLAGICPYRGPGIVFEAPWDVAGALQLAYADPTLRGDVVTPRFQIGDSGVTTEIFGEPSFYPYSSQLYVFDTRAGVLVETNGREAVERALATVGRGEDCAPGQPGFGQSIF